MKQTSDTRPAASLGLSVVDIPKISDWRGNLGFVQNGAQIPFDIARTEWIYHMRSDGERQWHAFYTCRQFMIPLSGCFDIEYLDPMSGDTSEVRRVTMSSPARGALIEPTVWRRCSNFSTNCVVLVVSSELSSATDRITDFQLYKEIADGNE